MQGLSALSELSKTSAEPQTLAIDKAQSPPLELHEKLNVKVVRPEASSGKHIVLIKGQELAVDLPKELRSKNEFQISVNKIAQSYYYTSISKEVSPSNTAQEIGNSSDSALQEALSVLALSVEDTDALQRLSGELQKASTLSHESATTLQKLLLQKENKEPGNAAERVIVDTEATIEALKEFLILQKNETQISASNLETEQLQELANALQQQINSNAKTSTDISKEAPLPESNHNKPLLPEAKEEVQKSLRALLTALEENDPALKSSSKTHQREALIRLSAIEQQLQEVSTKQGESEEIVLLKQTLAPFVSDTQDSSSAQAPIAREFQSFSRELSGKLSDLAGFFRIPNPAANAVIYPSHSSLL